MIKLKSPIYNDSPMKLVRSKNSSANNSKLGSNTPRNIKTGKSNFARKAREAKKSIFNFEE